jgi:quinol monooxygenase YgiN
VQRPHPEVYIRWMQEIRRFKPFTYPEPGYLQYSVHRPLGEDKDPLLVIQRYTSLEAYQEHSSWARGQAPRISELLATPPAPPVLFEP